jgi:rhodanese-related sulfurtransferase
MRTEQSAGLKLRRLSRRPDAFLVPQPVEGETGRFVVDGTWGTINPIALAPGVRTVGELEVIAHIERGLPVIDSRRPEFFSAATIPGAKSLPYTAIPERARELDPAVLTVLFCNGPQCSATPQAIRALLDGRYPPERLLYYRGGMHDWLTLGLPSVPGATT